MLELAEVGEIYCRLMEEIVVRDELVLNVLAGHFPITEGMEVAHEMRDIARAEFCYQQLRLITELIALACLMCHGDVDGARSSSLRGTYAADRIMNALSRLHPKFYPRPTNQELDPVTGKVINVVDVTQGYLTKPLLLELCHECGMWLHRGSLNDLRSVTRTTPDLKRIERWSNRIWGLLTHHQLQLVNPELQIVGLIKDKITARAQLSFWQRQANGTYLVVHTARAT